MDRQLKQTALPCQLSGEHFRDHYIPLTRLSALADVASRVDVGGRFVATAGTFEGGLGGAVLLVDVLALVALPRGVAWIDKDQGDTGSLRLIDEELSELCKSPITQSCSLVAALGRNPSADACQFLQGNPASGAFSVSNKRLRNHMVSVGLVSPLFSSQLAEPTFGALGAAFLQPTTAILNVLPLSLNVGAGIDIAIAIDCEGNDPQIDTKPILGLELVGFGNVTGCGQYPLATDKAQIDLAFAEGHKPPLVLAHDNRNHDAATQSPDTDGGAILNEPDNSVIVGLGGIGTEDRGNVAVHLESVRDLGDGSNSSLGSQAEPLTDGGVGHLVKVELPEHRSVKADLSKPRRSLIAPLKRHQQASGLFFRRRHLNGSDQLHNVKYGEYSVICQTRRTAFAAAIPLPAKAGSFSRGKL